MKETLYRHTCDCCKKTGETTSWLTPPTGWFEIRISGKRPNPAGGTVTEFDTKEYRNFCSGKCLIEFVSKYLEIDTGIEKTKEKIVGSEAERIEI